MDKKDEEEIKKWQSQNMNYIETYGVDIFKTKKQSKIATKLFNLFNKITKALLIIFAIFIVVFMGWLLISKWAYIESQVHIDPVKTIKQMYNQKIKVISKDLDENRNGKYILQTKESPEIEFMAITEWTTMKNDYSDRCQKYYFDRWKDENKNKIITEERYEDGLLKYNQYIEVSDYEQIEENIKIIYKFIQYASENFFPDWEVSLKTPKGNIYPFDRLNMKLEDAINTAKKDYLRIQVQEKKEEKNNYEDVIKSLFM